MAQLKINGHKPSMPSQYSDVAQIRKAMLAKAASSGLSTKDVDRLGFEPLSAHDLEIMKMKGEELPAMKAGFRIPYFSPTGAQTSFWRFRYMEPTKTGWAKITDRKELRYVQLPDSINEIYLPPFIDWSLILADPETPLIITEGELKAACATKMGLWTIGLGGVWMFRVGEQVLPQLLGIAWAGRTVYVCYDSDAASNPKVRQAENALCRTLLDLGAVPYIIRLPPLPEGKAGLDDFLVEKGKAEFQELQDAAEPWVRAKELHQLNEEVIYVRDPGFIVKLDTHQKLRPTDFVNHAYSNRLYVEITEKQVTDDNGKPYLKTEAKEKLAPREWLKWKSRGEVERITFAPGQPLVTEHDELNSWKGWGCEPKSGDCTPFLDLLDYFFDGEPEARKWFEQWLAYPLQHPGTKLRTSCLVWGGQGVGKSLIGYVMQRIYGLAHWSEISDADLESAGFNSWASDRQFVMGDEITGGDKRGSADRLKRFISQETMKINIKFIPEYRVPDRINYYFTSNHPDSFFLEDDDRRYMIHQVKGAPLEEAFYLNFGEWMEGDGPATLFAYLLDLDLEGFSPFGNAPMSESKADMIDIGKSDLDSWVCRLRDAPETLLKMGEVVLQHNLWTTEELLNLYDPAQRGRATANGVARALRRAGFEKANKGMGCYTATKGQQRLWVIREPRKYRLMSGQEVGAAYDIERGGAPKSAPKIKFASRREAAE